MLLLWQDTEGKDILMEDESKQIEISLSDLWLIFKRCWWIMMIVGIAVTILVYTVLNVTHEDEYTATVTIWAMRMPDSGGSQNGVSTSDVSIATYLINDYKLLIKSDAIMEQVINQQNLPLTTTELSRCVSITNETNTRVMYLSVTTKSAKSAKTIADTWGTVFCNHINTTLGGEPMVELWALSREPDRPSNPVSMMTVLLIAFVGAVFVYGIYFIKFILDDKVNSPEDVEKYLSLNVLGSIPDKNSLRRRRSKDAYYYSYGSNYDGGNKKEG